MVSSHACDYCKRRKVKCNGADPCSRCDRSGIPCERRTNPRRRGPRVAKRPADANTEGLPQKQPCMENRVQEALGHDDPLHFSPVSVRDDGLGGSSARTRTGSVPVVIHTFVDSPCSITSAPENILWDEFLHVRRRLTSRFNSVQGLSGHIEQVAHECVDLFMQYLFPNTPIAHEPTLRAGILLLGDELPGYASTESSGPEGLALMELLRRFALITALCAHIISVVPESLFQNPKSLSDIFFEASKSMLRTYEAYDLEHPDSTSLTIRMWHSSYAQNTTGKVGASWHYHTEACCLAQRMRLFDEASVARPSQVESQLLRVNFWHLYLAEKTQVAFKSRPPIIDERICDGITLLERGDEVVPFLDPSREVNQPDLESRIFVGFHLRRRISATAAGLINDIASHTRHAETSSPSTIRSDRTDQEMDPLIERYLKFTALVNEVPPWVRRPDGDRHLQVEESIRAYQTTCFWAQRTNIMTIFHCMRLLILQACIDHDLPVIVGLSESPLAWASRKLEIIRDFLDDLQSTPFVCIAAQGETAVDKVRRVGAILLELLHSSDNATIRTQAELLFNALLDILSRLDSKASEGLEIPGVLVEGTQDWCNPMTVGSGGSV